MIIKILLLYVAAILLLACGSGNEIKDHSDTVANNSMAYAKDSLPPIDTVPTNLKVFFKNIKEGQTVLSPLMISFGVNGMATDTTGSAKYSSGHFHLLIDAGDSIPSGMIITNDSTHLHFDSAQTQTQIKLLAGKHKLALQYGDGLNRSYGEKLAKSVNIIIK